MAYLKRTKRIRTLEEMCGIETFKDSASREWHIKVFTLGEISLRFFDKLFTVLTSDSFQNQAMFLSSVLYSPEPSAWIRLRRACGMPDFSIRWIKKNFIGKDFIKCVDASIQANLDMTLEQYSKKLVEANEKKKME